MQPDDVATLIYTSGTTGNPKGVEMTHANLLFEAFAIDEVLGVRFGDRSTSFLPTAHIADRMGALYMPGGVRHPDHHGLRPQGHRGGVARRAADDLGAVPRVWEKLKAAIEFAAANEPDETKRHGAAVGAGGRGEEGRCAGRRTAAFPTTSPPSGRRPTNWCCRSCGRSWASTRSGGRYRARRRSRKETLAFFVGLGIPIAEVWGMSELSCVATVSHPCDARLGTVGKLLPGMEGRIAEDGEFLVRGPLVMKGYRKEPQKTAEAVDDDGWLHTGDILQADDDGYLKIVDRKKELIINAAGKNMSPANIENTIKAACPLIGVILVVGDARPYNTALIVLDAESAAPYAAQQRAGRRVAGGPGAAPWCDRRDRGRGRRGQHEVVEGGADQAISGAADILGARR